MVANLNANAKANGNTNDSHSRPVLQCCSAFFCSAAPALKSAARPLYRGRAAAPPLYLYRAAKVCDATRL